MPRVSGRPSPFRHKEPEIVEDAWANPQTGIGVWGQDKTKAASYLPVWRVLDQELTSLYNGSDIAAKIISKRPEEMFRRGFDIEAANVNESEKDAVRDFATEFLAVETNLREGSRWGRLYGGCLLIMGIDDGRMPWEPLDEDNIRSFDSLSLVDRRYSYVQSQYAAMGMSSKYGNAQIYLISNAVAGYGWDAYAANKITPKSTDDLIKQGAQVVLVHESRVLRFDGHPADITTRQNLAGWSWSVLQRVYDSMRQFDGAFDSAGYLLSDASQGVFKLQGLLRAISSGQRANFAMRLQLLEQTRSVMHGIALDAGDPDGGRPPEEFTRVPTPFGGIPELLDKMMLRMAAAADMPATILFGRAPAGMNATGESDMRGWYDTIESEQKNDLGPQLKRVFKLLALSKKGPLKGRKVKWNVKFHPLWSPTDDERAKTLLSNAQRDQIYVTIGCVKPEEISLDLTDVYPNLDIEAREEALESKVMFDPYENQPAPEGSAQIAMQGAGEPLSSKAPVPLMGTSGTQITKGALPAVAALEKSNGASHGAQSPATGGLAAEGPDGKKGSIEPTPIAVGGVKVAQLHITPAQQGTGKAPDTSEKTPKAEPAKTAKAKDDDEDDDEDEDDDAKKKAQTKATVRMDASGVGNIKAAKKWIKNLAAGKPHDPSVHTIGTALALGWLKDQPGPRVPSEKGIAEHKLSDSKIHAILGETHLATAHRLTSEAHAMPEGLIKENFHKNSRSYKEKAAEHAELAGSDWDESKHPRNEQGHFDSGHSAANDSADPEGNVYAKDASIVVVWNAAGKVLCLTRPDPPYEYALPGGHVDPGENPMRAAVREMREELGVLVSELMWKGDVTSPDGTIVHVWVAGRVEGVPRAAEQGFRMAWLAPDELLSQAGRYRECVEQMMMSGALRKPIGGFVPSHGQRETGPGDPVVADDIYEDSVAKFIRFRIDKEMPEDNKKQAKAVFQLLLDDYPASSLGWILAAHWDGPVEIPTDEIDSSNRDSWRASHDGTHESFKQKVGAALEGKSGGIRKPAVLVKVPGEAKYKIVDGHHRFLAHESLGAPLLAYVAEMHVHNGPWDELHTLQKKGKSGARSGSVREPSWAGANAPAPEPRKDDGDFDESKHPRAPDGRFGEGGEGSKEAKAPSGHIEGKRTWTDKVPDGMQDETWKAHYDKHPDKGGKASPERQRDVHEPIIKAALNEAKPASPVEQKIAIMTMGAPASGKSSALRGVDSSRFVKIDADAIKENLPEYQKAIADKDATYKGAAAMAHEESSAISREILKRAIASGHHVIIDGTGKDSDAFMRKMRMLQAAGYHVHVVMPHVEEEEGIKRLKSRAEATGRMVPEHFARDAYKTIPKNFERIAREADSFKLFDNSGKEAKPVWEGGKGKADTVHDKDFVEKFRSQHHDAGDFDEEKHPRASNGQFGEGGGEGGSPKAGSAEEYFAADKGRLGRLRDYTDFDYAKMNEFKRDPLKFAQAHGEKAADAQKAKADAFLQDLKGAPKSPGVALRGVQLSPDAIAKFKPGADTVARGFWSATSDTSQAEGFSKQTAAGAVKKVSGDKTAVLHITHQSGVSLGKASSRPEEKEVVIPHGTSFHVDKVETKGGVHHIYLTEKTRAS